MGRHRSAELKDSFYARNRDYILAKLDAQRKGLPLPEKPEKAERVPKEVSPEQMVKKEMTVVKKKLDHISYNENYYKLHSEELKEKARQRRLQKRSEKVDHKEMHRQELQNKLLELSSRLRVSLD
jgi:hypothetical protein